MCTLLLRRVCHRHPTLSQTRVHTQAWPLAQPHGTFVVEEEGEALTLFDGYVQNFTARGRESLVLGHDSATWLSFLPCVWNVKGPNSQGAL